MSRFAGIREGEAPAEPNPKSLVTIANTSRKSRRHSQLPPEPPEIADPLGWNEITPEIIALRAIYGRPIRPALIEDAQRYNPLWPRPCEANQRLDSRLSVAAAPPPVEDCSAGYVFSPLAFSSC